LDPSAYSQASCSFIFRSISGNAELALACRPVDFAAFRSDQMLARVPKELPDHTAFALRSAAPVPISYATNCIRRLLGVDICEAGFPIASDGDYDAVRAVATEVGPMVEGRYEGRPMRIAGLARALPKDIERCHSAVCAAPLHRVHTFLATSDVHLEHKLKISRAECVKRAAAAVVLARQLVDSTSNEAQGRHGDVEFSPEDAGRSDPEFLVDVLTAVIESGANTLNIPDTVGFVTPNEYRELFALLAARLPSVSPVDGRPVILSTHAHNDLGLAVANTLAGVEGGARQVEVTMNGIGERAGNASLEEVIMSIRTRPERFPVEVPQIDTTRITSTSRLVSAVTGMGVQPNKSIVGANAFAHESGIHQDGVLKHAATYEILTPESVGLGRNSLVLGKHSGRAAYRQRLEALGFGGLSDVQLNTFVQRFKKLADTKKSVSDADILAIVQEGIDAQVALVQLGGLHVTCGSDVKPTATVTVIEAEGAAEEGSAGSAAMGSGQVQHSAAAIGNGPIDALFRAFGQLPCLPAADLVDFAVRSVTDGRTALGEVTIRLRPAASGMDSQGTRDLSGLEAVDAAVANPHTKSPRETNGDEAADASPDGSTGGLHSDVKDFEEVRMSSSEALARYQAAVARKEQEGARKRAGASADAATMLGEDPLTTEASGVGLSTDILQAAARAYLSAANRLLHRGVPRRRDAAKAAAAAAVAAVAAASSADDFVD